jgi:succinate dehydrogenase / fumarate reductase cytochrome b subunit
MRRVLSLYRSSVGKKILMAATGVLFVFFVIAHMIGNLKAFLGPEHFDEYAEFLRVVGEPALPHGSLLWGFRIALLACLAIHAGFALVTWRTSTAARPVKYAKALRPDESTFASRTMRWGGVALFLFVVAHLMHFTTGQLHPDFRPGEAYHNLVLGFQTSWVAVTYIVVMCVLALHVYHGVWSGMQTLGLSHERYNRYRRPVSLLVTLVVFLGFISVPVGVLTGALALS